jgi:hypothetical protein
MATPWVNRTKSIANIAHGTQPASNTASGFVPPTAVGQISFTPLQLYGSVARVKALLGASVGVTNALAASAEHLIRELVDEAPPDFVFTGDVLLFADATRTAFSGDIGAAIADRYMDSLGYIWRDNARSLVPKGSVADFVYDGPPTNGAGVVFTEAKGSVTASATATSIATTTVAGYQSQVAPFVGTTQSGTPVLHGYAIGTASQPGGSNSFIHVEETSTVAASSTAGSGPSPGASSPRGTGPSHGSGGSSGGDHGTVEPVGRPDPTVALGNYRAVFALCNTPNVVDVIDSIRSGRAVAGGISPQQFLRVRDERTPSTYLIGLGRDGQHYRNNFAIEERIASSFLLQLPVEFPTETVRFSLPIIDRVTIRQAREDGNEVFPDGLAILSAWGPSSQGRLLWVPGLGKLKEM